MGLGSTLFLSLYVSVCLCLCICLFVTLRLSHYHHQMMSFQKIYGLYGLEHHTVEINGDVTMRTDGQTNKQVNIGLHTVHSQCTMWKLKNEPKSVQLWKHFSPWMLMLEVPNFKQRYLNSPKMEICENIWKYWGKVGGKFQKSWRGWLIKSRLVSKKPSRRADFFL